MAHRPLYDPADYPPIPAFSGWGVLSPLILVPAVVPALALYLAPQNVLDAVPALRAFTSWMVRQIPSMTVHADATRIPQVATLVNCLVVAAAIFIALVFAVQSTLNYRYLYRRHMATGPHPPRTYLGGFIGLPFGVFMLAALVAIPGDPSWAVGATQNRTLFYGLLAVATPYLAGLMVGFAPFVLRLFLDGYLFSRPVTLRDG